MKQPSPYFTPAKTAWIEYYKSRTCEDYYFTGKDAMHLTQLIKKIQAKLSARSMEPTVENVVGSLTAFLNSITDKWILDNLEIAKVNSNWNSLYAKAVKQSPLGRQESIDEVIRKRNSERAAGGGTY